MPRSHPPTGLTHGVRKPGLSWITLRCGGVSPLCVNVGCPPADDPLLRGESNRQAKRTNLPLCLPIGPSTPGFVPQWKHLQSSRIQMLSVIPITMIVIVVAFATSCCRKKVDGKPFCRYACSIKGVDYSMGEQQSVGAFLPKGRVIPCATQA